MTSNPFMRIDNTQTFFMLQCLILEKKLEKCLGNKKDRFSGAKAGKQIFAQPFFLLYYTDRDRE